MNKKLILSFQLYLLFVVGTAFSQPQTEWVVRYNNIGNYSDYVTDMVVDDSGNVYLTGYIYYSSYYNDFLTLKYNTTGTLQWAKIYDGPYQGYDKANTIALDKQGNVYVSGESQNIYGKAVYAVVKYSNSGAELWTREYINTDSMYAVPRAMTVDDSGSVYVTGSCGTSLAGGDFTTIKFNTNGVFQWVRYFGGTANVADIPYAIAADENNNVYITGVARDSGNIYEIATIKYNTFGIQKWAVKYFGINNYPDVGRKISVHRSGDVFVGGYSDGGFVNQYDFIILCYDSLGQEKWVRRYSSTGASNPNDYLIDMTIDDSSNVYVTGISDSIQNGWDYTTLKYNKNGDWLWINRYNAAFNSNDEPGSIALDKYGNVYVTGKVDSNFLWYRYRTVKYSQNGIQDWAIGYNNNSPFLNHEAVKVKTDTLGNVYVTGNSEGSGTGMDIATIKYSNPTFIHKKKEEIPGEYKLYQNYPNPFNNSTTIEFDIKKNGFYKIEIYDVLGRKVDEILNEFKQAGSYRLNFSAEKLSSGVYFYKIESESFTDIKSMVLIK